jgi:hypothetical protein
MRFILSITLLTLFNHLNAQHIVGIKGGMNIVGYDAEVYARQPLNTINRAIGGLTYDYKLNDHWSLGAGLVYNQRGRSIRFTFTDEHGDVVAYDQIEHKMDYLSIPLGINYKTSGTVFAFAGIAFMPSIIMNSEWVFAPSLGVPSGPENRKNYNPMDWGGMAELGIGYKISEQFSIQLAGGYQRGYTKLKNHDMTLKHYGYMATLGLKYSL